MILSSSTAGTRLSNIFKAARPERIVVHAGRVKTGSTYLQANMMELASTLEDHGWFFPQSLLKIGDLQYESRGLRTTGHACLAKLAAKHSISAEILERFQEEAQDKKGKCLLLSAENLGRDSSEGRLSGLEPIFDGLDVEIIVYLRRPSDWINSYYMEQITGGHQHAGQQFDRVLEDFRKAADALGFVDQCQGWRKKPTLRFRNYDLARRSEHGLLGDFCQSIGLPRLPEATRPSVNKSSSYILARGIRIFNNLTRGLSSDDYKSLYAELLDRLASLDDGAQGSFLSSSLAAEIDAEWSIRNTALVEGGYMLRHDYDELTSTANEHPSSEVNPALEARILTEICDFLLDRGVTGFATPPTVSGVGMELRRRLAAGLRRRYRRKVSR